MASWISAASAKWSGPKQLKMERGDVRVRTRGRLTALVWKDRQEVYMLTNMDPPPAEGNFCYASNRPMKPHFLRRYNRHMGYVDNPDHMANSYLISQRNQVDHKIIFPPSRPNSTQQLDTVIFMWG